MKKLQQLSATAILTLALTCSAFAGDLSGGRYGDLSGGKSVTTSGDLSGGKAVTNGDLSGGRAVNSSEVSFTEYILSLLSGWFI